MITLGAVALALAVVRIFVFKLPESPRYLLSKGRDAEAVEVVNYVARYNGKPETLTLDMLRAIDEAQAVSPGISAADQASSRTGAEKTAARLSHKDIIRESFRDYTTHGYRRIFAGRKMAQHSSVSFLLWLTIGIAYPLYFAFITSYLETKSSYSVNSSLDHTYMVYCIVSAVGVLGPIAAGFSVETRLGRRWMMAISSVLTGVFLFAYTAVDTETADIGFQCATAILGNFGQCHASSFPPRLLLNAFILYVLVETNLLFFSLSLFRIRNHVCLHPRIISWSSSRYWNGHRCDAAADRRPGGLADFHVRWILRGAYICECCALDCGGLLLSRPPIRDTWPRFHLTACKRGEKLKAHLQLEAGIDWGGVVPPYR